MNKKILEARFVNFGDEICFCYQQTLFCEESFDLYNSPLLMGESWHRREKSFIEKREQFDQWLETLNSGDATVPRIVRQENGYLIVATSDPTQDVWLSTEGFEALNRITPLSIYIPKKYEANWTQLYPRDSSASEVCSDRESPCGVCSAAIEKINQLQQTESGGLEIWHLTITEQ